jgi:hypothetical protein
VRNQRARNKNNFLPYREVTPSRRQLQIEIVSISMIFCIVRKKPRNKIYLLKRQGHH